VDVSQDARRERSDSVDAGFPYCAFGLPGSYIDCFVCWLQTFRNNLLFHLDMSFLECLILESRTDTLSRNIGRQTPILHHRTAVGMLHVVVVGEIHLTDL
jgi:hypothetical protein